MISDSEDDDDDNDDDDNITRIYSCTKKARDRDYKACFGNRTLLGNERFQLSRCCLYNKTINTTDNLALHNLLE